MTTHKMSYSRVYVIWQLMIQRCENPKNDHYQNYGGRSIAVCERWHKFENFLADMGNCPKGMSIERIDNNGNYELRNCKWATRKEQNNNSRRNHFIEFNGQKKTIQQWAEYFGIHHTTLRARIRLKWPIEKLFIPSLWIRHK
jgi:hypothetical protein